MEKERRDGMGDGKMGDEKVAACSGKVPEGYGELCIFVWDMGEVICISEGDGDNLFREDEEEGYVDYIYYEQYAACTGMPSVDGGIVLLEGKFRDMFRRTADCIPYVLDMAYGCSMMPYAILA